MILPAVCALVCVSLVGAASSSVISELEQKFRAYFAPTSANPFLHQPTRHTEFRSFEDHDMSYFWGFFELPGTDDLIESADDITCNYCNGDGIYSLSRLLAFTLLNVFDSLSEDKTEHHRLGFFKLFPDRIAHRPYDAYLHHLNGGGRLTLTVQNAVSVVGSKELFSRMVRDLCGFLSNDYAWSSQFVGLTFSLPVTSAMTIEVWTAPDMRITDLRALKVQLEAMSIECSPTESIRFAVSALDTISPDEAKAAKVRSLFLSPQAGAEKAVVAEPVPLKAEWLVVAAAFPQVKGSFEGAGLVCRRASLLRTVSDFERICKEKLLTFPGVLAKNSYTSLVKKCILTDSEYELVVNGKLFNINYRPAVHQAFTINIKGLKTYADYAEKFRLVALYLVSVEHQIGAAFFHLDVDKANPSPETASLEIELWAKKNTKTGQLTKLWNALSEFIAESTDAY